MRRSVRSTPRPAARRAVLDLQTLEGREVPAGNVVASLSATGQLTLVGDNAGNAITIRVTGTSVTVTGSPGTTVNGHSSVTRAGVVRAVQANMNAGDDVVRIDAFANFLVPGSVAVNLGAGNNTLNLQTSGRLALGSLDVVGAAGNDAVAVAGGVRTGSVVTGTTSIALGGGADAVTLRRITFGAVSVTTGDGADTLTIDDSTFSNTFSAALGTGNDTIRLGRFAGSASPVDFRRTVSINAGAGDDSLLLGRAVTGGGDANSRVIFRGGIINGDAAGTFNFLDPVNYQATGPVFLLGWV
jgi:hypothetical protein